MYSIKKVRYYRRHITRIGMGVAGVLLPLFLSCTKFVFDNPFDPNSTNQGKPYITEIVGDEHISLTKDEPYEEFGIKVSDDKDKESELLKNLKIIIRNKDSLEVDVGKFTEKPGEYTVYYQVRDSEGKLSNIRTRRLSVIADGAPFVLLLGPNPYILNIGDYYNEPNGRAFKDKGTEVENAITILSDKNKIDNSTPGIYYVLYQTSDKQGVKKIKRRTVRVQDSKPEDKIPPLIEVRGNNPETVAVGQNYIDAGATASDAVDGTITNKIKTYDAVVPTAKPLEWRVWYVVEDNAGNVKIKTRQVTVK
ncbi:MAG: DUF5011 domain-containing protein [Chitinivibrionales bacterium]|nr:DUF5011 domain-containing protein [Chitinivibrionales bacterium]